MLPQVAGASLSHYRLCGLARSRLEVRSRASHGLPGRPSANPRRFLGPSAGTALQPRRERGPEHLRYLGGVKVEVLATTGTTLRRGSGQGAAGTCAGTCSLFDRCWTMFALMILLSLLPIATLAFPHCTRSPEASTRLGEQVFTSKEEANSFIHRHLLYNRFDLELFTSGDLERECYEELCNFEEAKEIFVDEDKTMAFWQEYLIKQPTVKSGGNSEKIDVMGLLTGLIAAGVFLVIFGILGYYVLINKCSRQRHPGSSRGRQTPSIIFRRPEEAALSPSPPAVEDTGLPSYEQAMALTRKHSISPPPPYPGPAKGFRVFKKSMSLPSH